MTVENVDIRVRSGSVNVDSRLVAFLYTLMRDTVPFGEIERIVKDSQCAECEYSNGWLASYAEDVARRLGDDPKRT